MKLAYPHLQQVLEIHGGDLVGLVIENPGFLYELLMDLDRQMKKEEGEAVLSVDDVPVEISQNVELITDFIGFDANQRGLLNKIASALTALAQNEVNVERTNRLLALMETYVNELTREFDANISCNAVTMQAVLKGVGLHIEETSDSLGERLLSYMKLIREFDRDKLFIFVNLRSYLMPGELKLFSDMIVLHGYRTLFIDSQKYPLLDGERRLIVDKDLCEI